MTGTPLDSAPVDPHPGVLAMPRRRGTLIGVLLVLLGLWGGLSPLIGPWFGYHVDDDGAWILTWDRLWLTTVPGAVTVIGGVVLYLSRDRLSAAVAAWLAIAGGAWFVVGPSVSALWSSTLSATGIGRGTTTQRLVVELCSFYGLGVAITGLASFALARVLVRSERDAVVLRNEAVAATEAVRLREERERVTGEADKAAQARADTEREHERAQQEREALEQERLRVGAAPVVGVPAESGDPAGSTPFLPGQRPAPAISGEYPVPPAGIGQPDATAAPALGNPAAPAPAAPGLPTDLSGPDRDRG